MSGDNSHISDPPANGTPASTPRRRKTDGPQAVIVPPALQEAQRFLAAADKPPANPLTILLRLLRGRWMKTLSIAAFFGVLCATIASFFASPLYQSEGLVRIVAREPKILYADRDDSRLRLFDAFVAGEATYIQSRTVLERAYATLKKVRENPDQTPSYKRFNDSLTVQKLKGLISITSTSQDARLARDQVNAVLDGYAALHAEQSERRHNLRTSELETRIQELLARRARLEQRLLDIGGEYDSASLRKAHMLKVTELEEVDNRLAELANSISRMEASSNALDADTGDMEIKRATLLDRAMADMVFERAKRAAELAQMSLRYQGEHPQVARRSAALAVIDQAIEHRRRLIATLGKTGAITGSDGATASQSLAELIALRDKLSARRMNLSADAKKLNGKLIKMLSINSERGEVSSMIAETRRVLDQVRLESRNSLPGTAEVLSRGHVPVLPFSNKRKALMALGLIAGGGLAVIVLLARFYLHPQVRYSDEIISLFPASEECCAGMVSPTDAGIRQHCLISFVAGLHFDPAWQRDRATMLTTSRFDQDTYIEFLALAEAASDLGLRTLVITCSADGVTHSSNITADMPLYQRSGYDIGFADLSDDSALSAEAASRAFRQLAGRYDIIIVDAGDHHDCATSQTLVRIADMRLALIRPGNGARQIRSFAATYPDAKPLIVRARPDDPIVVHMTEFQSPSTIGEQHA